MGGLIISGVTSSSIVISETPIRSNTNSGITVKEANRVSRLRPNRVHMSQHRTIGTRVTLSNAAIAQSIFQVFPFFFRFVFRFVQGFEDSGDTQVEQLRDV
jgi:hypothetical protein